jgi:hypothetical protein
MHDTPPSHKEEINARSLPKKNFRTYPHNLFLVKKANSLSRHNIPECLPGLG